MQSLGVKENDLYFTNKNSFIHYNPQIKSQSNRYKELCFLNNEIKRNNLINRCRSERKMFLLNELNNNSIPEIFNNDQNDLYSNQNYTPNVYYKNYIYKNKSMTDFWKLRYDKTREDERFYFLEKQNLAEIKKLIDTTVKLHNQARQINFEHEIDVQNEIKKKKSDYELKKLIDKEYLKKERFDKELDLADKKRKEREFRRITLIKKKIDEEREQKWLDEQNELKNKKNEK